MHDLIIIGGGPAWLAAAAYGLDQQLDLRLMTEHVGGRAGWHRHPHAAQPTPPSMGEGVVRLVRERTAAHPERMLHAAPLLPQSARPHGLCVASMNFRALRRWSTRSAEVSKNS